MNHITIVFVSCLLFAAQCAPVQEAAGQQGTEIQDVVLYPVVNDTFMCAEHAEGELNRLGDALGKDCMVIRLDSTRAPGRNIPSLFEEAGIENDDWFSWEVPLLAPCDGVVKSKQANPTTNQPGAFPDREAIEPASEIVFRCQDGVHVIYAHVINIQVARGDSVVAGETVAEIGNNAVSTAPHVHVGAWKNKTPLQIRFDLRALGKMRNSD